MKDFTPFINTENRRIRRINMIDFNFPYKIDMRLYDNKRSRRKHFPTEYKKMVDWCDENLSSEYILWTDIPRFSNAADATLFKLSWC